MSPLYYCLSILLSGLLLVLPNNPKTTSTVSQNWQFKKEKEGIRVFTRIPKGSNLKELKITLSADASLTTIAAVLRDIPRMSKWVYKCSHSELLKEVSEIESIEYYKVDFPWPMTDRDLVVSSKMYQDKKTGYLHSVSTSYNDFKSKDKDLIRITNHRNEWIFEPISPNKVNITYYLSADPAGSIPNWLVNMVVDQGPVQSMLGFRKLLQEDRYRNAQIAGIKNY